tara:strand:- start:208 stop:882 length:675 start_codon:yes stop_codon:yes gene_type:complete
MATLYQMLSGGMTAEEHREQSMLNIAKKRADAKTMPKPQLDIHSGLDLLGMTPGVGVGADLLNTVLYTTKGDKKGALTSLSQSIPLIGLGSGLKKIIKQAKKSNKKTVTVYRAVGEDGLKPIGNKFIGSESMGGEVYATLDKNVAKKYASLNPNRKVMKFEIPKKWILENEKTIQMAIKEEDTFMEKIRKDIFEKSFENKTSLGKELRFTKEIGIPKEYLEKVY